MSIDAGRLAMDLVARHFPEWRPSTPSAADLCQLGEERAGVLYRALLSEVEGRPGFADRARHFNDLHQFDLPLNAIFSSLLASRTPVHELTSMRASNWFARNASNEVTEITVLRANGYQVSEHRLDPAKLSAVAAELADCSFVSKGIFTRRATGAQILARTGEGSLGRGPSRIGDTYWLEDLNQLVSKPLFQQLAFDPYILSTVARYLGCCPIHVQTNAWFSFPTYHDKWNYSANAQMFHQDKEFTKFIKVFIYLSDVGEENGPHCYVEGSHVDEVHRQGVQLSERIPDEEITRYFESGRVRKLTGPAGTITFGDTSCVHKGIPVRAGYRAMLQLEYASSLHLSPVCPFSTLADSRCADLPYSREIVDRLLANYNSVRRADFLRMDAATAQPAPGLMHRLVQLGKRYARRSPTPGA